MGFLNAHRCRTATPFAVVAIVLWISGCRGGYLERPWQIDHGDWPVVARTFERQYRVASDSLALPAAPLWTFEAGAGVSAQPLVVDSVVIVATLKGVVHLLSCATGEEQRSINLGKPIASSPAVSDSMMFVGLASGSEQLVAVDLLRGSVAWRIASGPMEASPSLVNDVLIVPTLGGRVLGLDAATGAERWVFAPKPSRGRTPFRGTPAITDSTAFVPCDDGTLFAISVTDGTQRWASSVEGSLFSSPLIAGDRVMVASTSGTVACLETQSGKRLWTAVVGGAVYANLSTDGSQLYVGTASREVRAIDIHTGSERWRAQGNGPLACAVAFNDAVIVGSLDRMLVSRSARDGEVRWQMEGEGRFRVAPVVSQGLFIVVTDDRRVTAYGIPR